MNISALGVPRPLHPPAATLSLLSPSSSCRALAPNERTVPELIFTPIPFAELVQAREVINHRAINNQYFSSNVYRVRFKCLVKTNLRGGGGGLDCALFAFSPFFFPHPPLEPMPIRRVYITTSADVNSLPDPSRNLCLRTSKEGRRLRNARGYYVEAILYTRPCAFRKRDCRRKTTGIKSRNSWQSWLFPYNCDR